MKVDVDQTCDFAEHWRYRAPGTTADLFVPMSPAAIQFACDWANIVLANFIETMVERQKRKMAAAAEAAKPAVVLTGADA